MAWFISDTHFNHSNIIKYCNRPFNNTKEMDDYIIKSWNSVVDKDDIVYHLGDFSFSLSFDEIKELVKSLNGDIILITGNHDRKGYNYFKRCGFLEVYKKNILINNYILSHRPIDSSLLENKINIHGHIHNKDYSTSVDKSKYINVSCEVLKYRPVWININN